MPPSFDDKVTIIRPKGDINPAGPLDNLAGRLTDDDKTNTVHLHFWITQQQGDIVGAFMQGQAMVDPGDPKRWMTKTPDKITARNPETDLDKDFELIHRHGPFLPGYAFAQAVAIVDPHELIWWARTIVLTY
jgi:hypothetical protein